MARIQLRRDTAANWASNNPVLAQGEPSLETDTGIEKIGDGVTAYNDLPERSGNATSSFPELTDTPSSYTGQAQNFPVVNDAETGLIFKDLLKPLGNYVGGTITIDETGVLADYTLAANLVIDFDDTLDSHKRGNTVLHPIISDGNYTFGWQTNGTYKIWADDSLIKNGRLAAGNYLFAYTFDSQNDKIIITYTTFNEDAPDTTAPQFVTGSFEVGNVADNIVVLPVDEALDPTSVPAVGDFAILVDASPNVVTNVDITTNPIQVRLTLTTSVTNGQTVTAAYTKGANPLQDVSANETPSLTATAVTNNVGSTIDLLTDLVSYWELDEASGSRADSHGTNTLTDNNTVTSAAGVISNAANFNEANSEYLSVADNASIDVGDEDFTIGFWVYLDNKTSAHEIFSKTAITTSYEYRSFFGLGIDRLAFAVSDDGTSGGLTVVEADTLGSPSTGTWYFVVCYHDSVNNEIGISVNDGAYDTAAHSTGVFTGTGNLNIGASLGTEGGINNPLDGRVDLAFLTKKKITDAEKTWLYNSGNGRAYSELT
jgi:uncharacterized repeat protein (TIGR02059 family)